MFPFRLVFSKLLVSFLFILASSAQAATSTYLQQDAADHAVWIEEWSWNASRQQLENQNYFFVAYSSPEWIAKGFADLNGDTIPDVAFQNASTHGLGFWTLNSGKQITGFVLVGYPTAGYDLRAVEDMNGDAHPDFVFQNVNTGEIGFWVWNGAQITGYVRVGYPSPGFILRAVGDLSGDQRPDLVFQQTDGWVSFWTWDNSQVTGFRWVKQADPTDWIVRAVHDEDRDGINDIVFSNNNTHPEQPYYVDVLGVGAWRWNGSQVTGWIAPPSPRGPKTRQLIGVR